MTKEPATTVRVYTCLAFRIQIQVQYYYNTPVYYVGRYTSIGNSYIAMYIHGQPYGPMQSNA